MKIGKTKGLKSEQDEKFNVWKIEKIKTESVKWGERNKICFIKVSEIVAQRN